MQPDVSVVVVNWNSGGHLARCLAALDDLPVIVMDNGSSDGSDRCVCKPTRLLRNPRNLGYGTAVNQAVNLTKSRFVLVLNPVQSRRWLRPWTQTTRARWLDRASSTTTARSKVVRAVIQTC